LIATLAPSTNARADMRKTLTPRISVSEEYDSNVDLTPNNEESDWITLISPGISLDLESPETMLTFDYEAGFSFYQDDSSRDSTRHQVLAEWEQELSQHLTFYLSDRFLRSEDPIEIDEARIEDIRRQRATYYRNTGETSLAYAFGAEDMITAGYRNHYYDDRSNLDQDSEGNEGFFDLDKWFGPRFGMGLTSLYNRSEFEEVDDFEQYGAGLTLTYRWVPARSVYMRYDLLDHDYEKPPTDSERNDFQVHKGVLGMSIGLGPHTEFSAEGGYYLQDYDNRGKNDGVMYNATFHTQVQRSSVRLEAGGGYDQDYYSSENLGSSEYHEILGSMDYLLTEDLRVFGSGNYRWEDFTEVDRTDKVWHATAGLSLSFWRWLSLSLQGIYTERDSDDPSEEFRDNRVMLRLTGAYPFRM
jgi:hypothetical protein